MIVFAMYPVNGIKTIEANILKIVCAFAICRGIFCDVWETNSAKVGIQKQNNKTPITLNVTCATATRLASLEAFKPAKRAVMQVPIFAPKISGIPASKVIDPPLASVITIPVVALLLWTRAVKIAPAKIPRKGFLKSTLIW